MRAKIAQEKLIKESSIPYSIVHATQFFEFIKSIADAATIGDKVRIPPVAFQPIAANDVASAVTTVAVNKPLNGTVEIAGPERLRFDEFIRRGLSARNDSREVVADPHARYFGTELSENSLVPVGEPQLGETKFEEWLRNQLTALTSQPATVAANDSTALEENEFRVRRVPQGTGLLVGEAAVFNVGGHLCATQDKCTHRQGPLSKGKLAGSTVTCPLHGSQFNVCTGEVVRGPATDPVKTYQVMVDGDIGRIEDDAAAGAKASTQTA